MKKQIQFTAVLILISICKIQAQSVIPPYSSGFDSPAEKAGWHQIRTGYLGLYDWGYDNFTSATPPTSLYHDYPVGSAGTDTTEDWFVSPPFDMTSHGILAFEYVIYSISGTTQPVDYFGVWFSPDGDDPVDGNYIEIANLTSKANSTFGNWLDTFGLQIPFICDSGYIAFRYRATNNWLTINVDSIQFDTEFAHDINSTQPNEELSIYPIPSNHSVMVISTTIMESITITDLSGRVIKILQPDSNHIKVDISALVPGIYTMMIRKKEGTGTSVKRFTVE